MSDEEQVFDFLAAAEDTGKQLDALIKAIPGEVRGILAAEYRQSPWLTTLPITADRVTAAAERAEAAAGVLTRKATIAGILVCLAAVFVPLSTWGYAYWQMSKLRQEKDVITVELSRLQDAADLLKGTTGGGAMLERMDNGEYVFTLPPGLFFSETVSGATSVRYVPKE